MAGADDVDQQKIEAARRKRDLDAKFRGMIREIAWQMIMLVLFTWVIVGSLDANVDYQNQDIKSAFIDDAEVQFFPSPLTNLRIVCLHCLQYMYMNLKVSTHVHI